jgi:hypothetical protein
MRPISDLPEARSATNAIAVSKAIVVGDTDSALPPTTTSAAAIMQMTKETRKNRRKLRLVLLNLRTARLIGMRGKSAE